MKTKITIGVIIIILVALVAYFNVNQSTHSESNAPQNNKVKIGLIGILSGEYATVGQNVVNGLILAKEQYEETHPDVDIELVIEDDGFESKKGISAYRKLTSVDKVDAIFNTSSPTIDAIFSEVSKESFPLVQLGVPELPHEDDNIFQITPGDVLVKIKLGQYTKSLYPTNTASVNSHMGVMTRFVNHFERGYGEGLNKFVVASDEKDYRTHALKVAQSDPEAVVIHMVPQAGAQFVKEYLAIDPDVQFIFGSSLKSGIEDYKRILGDISVLDGSIIENIEQPIDPAYPAAYEVRFGEKPGFFSEYGYDGFMVLMQAYDEDPDQWVVNLDSGKSFESVNGTITFDEKGVRLPVFALQILEDGELVDLAS